MTPCLRGPFISSRKFNRKARPLRDVVGDIERSRQVHDREAVGLGVQIGLVAEQVLELPFSVDWRLVATSTAIGVVASMVAGMLATRSVLSAPPTVSLRELA